MIRGSRRFPYWMHLRVLAHLVRSCQTSPKGRGQAVCDFRGLLRRNLKPPLARFCLALLLSLAGPGVAHAELSVACWTFEFVPGERVYQRGLGNVQRGRTFVSNEFSSGHFHRLKIAEAFEKHVRATIAPLSSKSQYVSDCAVASTYGSARGNAIEAHRRYLNEGNFAVESVAWGPSATELAAAKLADDEIPIVYMQCVLAAVLSREGERYDRPAQAVRTRVFKTEIHRDVAATDQLRAWGGANGIDGDEISCFAATTPERTKAAYADVMDHFGPGSTVRDIEFLPDFALPPGTAPKAVVAPKLAPAKPVAPGVLIIEDNGIAAKAKAWDDSVLQMRREAAAQRVKAAIATAESKANSEILRQKMLAEMRARGNKQ